MQIERLEFQSYRLRMVRDGSETYEVVSGPESLGPSLIPLFDGWDREIMIAVALDARNRPIGSHIVSVGTLSASLVHPREVLKFALLANSASIILAHNHPSGERTPSKEDIELTRRMCKAGEIMGIKILDHLVFGGEEYLSMKEQGLL
jgi:DNA repair protein RadC